MPFDQQPVGFSEKGARRVAHAARRTERFDRLRYNGTGPVPFGAIPRQRVGWPVKVTDQPSLGDPDLFPAVVQEFAGYLAGSPSWSDGEPCWVVRMPGDMAAIATGFVGPGELVGVTDDDEQKLIFAVGPRPAAPSVFGQALVASFAFVSSGTWLPAAPGGVYAAGPQVGVRYHASVSFNGSAAGAYFMMRLRVTDFPATTTRYAAMGASNVSTLTGVPHQIQLSGDFFFLHGLGTANIAITPEIALVYTGSLTNAFVVPWGGYGASVVASDFPSVVYLTF